MDDRYIGQGKINRTVEIRPLRQQDVSQVASLHALVFPDYFLTHLGTPFLNRFYNQFVEYPGIAMVAFAGEQCVGFVAGASQMELFFNRFYRKNFLLIMLITVQRLLLDSFIRKEIYKRVGHIRMAVSTVFRRKLTTSSDTDRLTEDLIADLLGIGVHPSCQGEGIADELVRQFCAVLSDKGIKTVSLTVRNNNARAIRFYEKTGWRAFDITGDSIQFNRSTDSFS